MESRLGTAEWEDLDVFAEKRAYKPGDFWLGRSPKNGEPIGHVDDRHIFLASKNRSGKGTTIIVNNLLTWEGSVVVVDPKGENATVTAGRRGEGSEYCEGMGQRVFVLDPFGASSVDEKYQASFNPLDALDPKSNSVIDDAGLVADAIIPDRPNSAQPYFEQTARKMLKGLILHVITAPHFEGRRNLLTVRALIRHGEIEGYEKIKAARAAAPSTDPKPPPLPSAYQLLWGDLSRNKALQGIIAGIGQSIAHSAMKASKTFDNCLSTLDVNTQFLDSFEMRNVLERSDFALADIKTDPKGVSLYLCLPQRYSAEHFRWLRLMNTLVITMMEEEKGQPATGHRVLMVLDEFLLLEHMRIIERAVSYIAGYGLTMFFIVQSLETLKKIYDGTWETLIANCGIKMFFAVGDHFSRKHISELIGETEVIREAEGSSSQEGTSTTDTEGTNQSSTTGSNQSSSTGTSDSNASGRSSSHGKSEQVSTTDGRNESQSDAVGQVDGWSSGEGKSTNYGHQSSETKGSNKQQSAGYTPRKLLLRNTDKHFYLLRQNETKSINSGNSLGTAKSLSSGGGASVNSGKSGSRSLSKTTTGGTSHAETSGHGRSSTEGTSETTTHGHSDTQTTGSSQGDTRGSSKSRASGATSTHGTSKNQTVHKRSLITPDEIGRWFARPEPGSGDPAWGLVIIDDAKPAVVHRNEYYIDPFFGWLFDPHPDHALPPKLMGENAFGFPRLIPELSEHANLVWTRDIGDCIDRGEAIAEMKLPGPAELVRWSYVMITGSIPVFPGVGMMDEWVELKVHAPLSGKLKLRYEQGEGGIEPTLRMGEVSGSNRRWLLETGTEEPIKQPVEAYSLFCQELLRMEGKGRRLEVERIEADRLADIDRRSREYQAEQKQIAQEHEDEQRRIAQEQAEQEALRAARIRLEEANEGLRIAKAEAKEKERRSREEESARIIKEERDRVIEETRQYYLKPPWWISDFIFGMTGLLPALFVCGQIAVAYNLHVFGTVVFLYVVSLFVYGMMAEPIHEAVAEKYRTQKMKKWNRVTHRDLNDLYNQTTQREAAQALRGEAIFEANLERHARVGNGIFTTIGAVVFLIVIGTATWSIWRDQSGADRVVALSFLWVYLGGSLVAITWGLERSRHLHRTARFLNKSFEPGSVYFEEKRDRRRRFASVHNGTRAIKILCISGFVFVTLFLLSMIFEKEIIWWKGVLWWMLYTVFFAAFFAVTLVALSIGKMIVWYIREAEDIPIREFLPLRE